MTTSSSCYLEPIETALRRVRRAISDAEWSGRDTAALHATLLSLLAAQARGERYAVPF